MRLTPEQIDSLDSWEWFPEDKPAVWDDDALSAFSLVRADEIEKVGDGWVRYVHFLSLTNPELVPSETFCRRVALTLMNPAQIDEATEEKASELTNKEIALLFSTGMLARVDSLVLDDLTAYEAIKNLTSQYTVRSSGYLALLNVFFALPGITSLYLEFFATEALRRNRLELEGMMVLASHPLTPKRVLRTVAKEVSPQMEALYKDEDTPARVASKGGGGHQFIAYSYISHHLKRSKALGWKLGRKLHDFVGVESASTFIDFYVGELHLTDLSKSYTPRNWLGHFHEWRDGTYGTYDIYLPADAVAILYGVGVDKGGIPPGIALYAATQLLVKSEQRAKIDHSDFRPWAIPYMRGSRAWLEKAMDADNVPVEWLVTLLGYEDNPSLDNWELVHATGNNSALVDS